MSAINKGKINWKTVKTGKKQERENDGTGFSMHLEGTIWHGQETGAPPSKRSARPPKDLAKVPGCWLIAEAQGEKLKDAMDNLEGLCEHWGWEIVDP